MMLINEICRLEEKKTYFLIGYYVVAGIPIQIDIIDKKGSNDSWTARIGCHTDDISVRKIKSIFFTYILSHSSIVMNFVVGHVYQSAKVYRLKLLK